MRTRNKLQSLLVLLCVFALASCSLDDTKDINNPSPDEGDVNYVLNSVQLEFADFFYEAHRQAAPLVRMEAMTTGFRYEDSYLDQNLDNIWENAYRKTIYNARLAVKLANDHSPPASAHIGIAKTIEAYTWFMLVDLFGKVPFREAFKVEPSADSVIFNPKATEDREIYDSALVLLDQAEAAFNKKEGIGLARDIYYDKDLTKWKALIKTLRLRAWVNTNNTTKIATYVDLATGALKPDVDIIDKDEEEFTYKYGAVTIPAGSRHPLYDQYYQPAAGSASGYIGNFYMYKLYKDYTAQDPRWRYYFYRQVGSIEPEKANFDIKAIGCKPGVLPLNFRKKNFNEPFCVFEPGFYGRDHGDGGGIPPDSKVITCVGIYPAGGLPDNESTENAISFDVTVQGDGANGAGIQPIWMAFYTDYLLAEITENRALLIKAIQNSIKRVKKFADDKGQSVILAPWTSAESSDEWNAFVKSYTDAVGTAYDATAAGKPRKAFIGKEFYKALMGNGVEAYNSYRRTGGPTPMQPLIQESDSEYMRSFYYPAVYVNLNANAEQKNKSITNKVFWDTNTDDLE